MDLDPEKSLASQLGQNKKFDTTEKTVYLLKYDPEYAKVGLSIFADVDVDVYVDIFGSNLPFLYGSFAVPENARGRCSNWSS